uniref:Uncharacterized protein n=1 Tax=Anopheles albimanus TaxID=7167 RepID=A0A182FHR8_ANOAL
MPRNARAKGSSIPKKTGGKHGQSVSSAGFCDTFRALQVETDHQLTSTSNIGVGSPQDIIAKRLEEESLSSFLPSISNRPYDNRSEQHSMHEKGASSRARTGKRKGLSEFIKPEVLVEYVVADRMQEEHQQHRQHRAAFVSHHSHPPHYIDDCNGDDLDSARRRNDHQQEEEIINLSDGEDTVIDISSPRPNGHEDMEMFSHVEEGQDDYEQDDGEETEPEIADDDEDDEDEEDDNAEESYGEAEEQQMDEEVDEEEDVELVEEEEEEDADQMEDDDDVVIDISDSDDRQEVQRKLKLQHLMLQKRQKQQQQASRRTGGITLDRETIEMIETSTINTKGYSYVAPNLLSSKVTNKNKFIPIHNTRPSDRLIKRLASKPRVSPPDRGSVTSHGNGSVASSVSSKAPNRSTSHNGADVEYRGTCHTDRLGAQTTKSIEYSSSMEESTSSGIGRSKSSKSSLSMSGGGSPERVIVIEDDDETEVTTTQHIVPAIQPDITRQQLEADDNVSPVATVDDASSMAAVPAPMSTTEQADALHTVQESSEYIQELVEENVESTEAIDEIVSDFEGEENEEELEEVKKEQEEQEVEPQQDDLCGATNPTHHQWRHSSEPESPAANLPLPIASLIKQESNNNNLLARKIERTEIVEVLQYDNRIESEGKEQSFNSDTFVEQSMVSPEHVRTQEGASPPQSPKQRKRKFVNLQPSIELEDTSTNSPLAALEQQKDSPGATAALSDNELECGFKGLDADDIFRGYNEDISNCLFRGYMPDTKEVYRLRLPSIYADLQPPPAKRGRIARRREEVCSRADLLRHECLRKLQPPSYTYTRSYNRRQVTAF